MSASRCWVIISVLSVWCGLSQQNIQAIKLTEENNYDTQQEHHDFSRVLGRRGKSVGSTDSSKLGGAENV